MKHWHAWAMALALLISCNRSGNPAESQSKEIVQNEPGVEAYAADTTAAASGETDKAPRQHNGSKEQSPPPERQRQIIKTATLDIECKDFAAFGAQLHALVQKHGGWIASEEETKSDYQQQNVVCIKVSVAQFDALLNSCATAGGKVQSRKITSEDVTNAIVDTKGRLQAKQQIRARYMELLKQAKTMEEILHVQNEINNITEELESTAYNLEHMQAQAAYSTVYLTYFQVLEAGGDSPNFVSRLWDAVKDGGSAMLEFMIGLVALWPLWLLLLGAVYWWRSRKGRWLPVRKQAA
ncbi:MAG TPA: DUF4349 domain-containing protein [Phnomibacter sp.]|nr:DUF4349 domain-containing protein [Phnomibacter sp.]